MNRRVVRVAAVVCAAGHGTLDGGNSPKLTAKIDGKPLIVHVVNKLLRLKRTGTITDICIVINPDHAAIMQRALMSALGKGEYKSLKFATQHWRRGAADAVACAMDKLNTHTKHVLVTFGDMVLWEEETIRKLIAQYLSARTRPKHAFSMVTLNLPSDEALKYGWVVRHNGRVSGIIETNDQRTIPVRSDEMIEINPSLYIFSKKFLWDYMRRIPPQWRDDDYPDEFHLPHFASIAYQNGLIVDTLTLPAEEKEQTLGVNTREQLAEVEYVLSRRRNAD